MAQEIIGTKDGQNFYVGVPDSPSTPNTAVTPPSTNTNPVGSSGTLQAITPQSLQSAQAITVPQSNYSTASADSYATNVSKTATDYMNETAMPTTELDKKYQAILDSIASLTSQDSGKNQALAQAKIDSGATKYSQDLADLNGQLAVKNAEYASLSANQTADQTLAETRGIEKGTPAVFYQGEQAAMGRQYAVLKAAKAAEIGMVSARTTAAAGNLTAALTIAQNAVDAKYAPIEDELKVKQSQLDALTPLMNEEQQVKATARQRMYQEADQKLQEEKDKAKQNLSIALTAGVGTKYANRNGEFFDTTTGQTFATPQEFFKAAGVTSFEQAYQRGLITDISNQKLADMNTVQQMMAKYPDAGIKANDSLDSATSKLKNSRIYKKDTYIAPNAYTNTSSSIYVPGADPTVDGYIAAIKNGNGTLQSVPSAYRGMVAQGLNQAVKSITDSATDAKVKSIIASIVPASSSQTDRYKAWDQAAKAINALVGGKDLATSYDSWLKSVYENQSSASQLGTNDVYTPLAGSRYALEATRITAPFTKLPAYETLSQAMVYLPRIAAAAANPGSVGDAELLDSIVKLNTGGNAITNEQVHLITNYGSYSDKLNRFQNQLNKKGGALSDAQRKELVQIAQETNSNYQKAYQPIYEQATTQLQQAGIPQQFWTIPDLNALSQQGQNIGDQSNQTSSVIPKGTDGAAYGYPGYVSDGTQWVLKQ